MPRWCALLALLVVALAGTTATGCGRPDVSFCNTDADCDNGDVCSGGTCSEGVPFRGRHVVVSGEGEGEGELATGEGEGEGEGDAGAAVDPCGAIDDGFDGDSLAAPFWTQFADGGADVGLADGALVVALPAQPELALAGVAAGPFAFTGRAVTVAIPQVPADEEAFAVVKVQAGAEDVYVVANGTRLQMVVDSHGATAAVDVAYDPFSQRFVRLREELGDFVLEISADDVFYAVAGRLSGPDLSQGALLGLVAQQKGATAPSTAAFNSVRSPAIQCP